MSTPNIFRAVAAITHALKDGIAADEAFAALPVSLGYPVVMADECAWVSYNNDDTRKPAASDLSLFENALHIGGGISVAQYVGEDWQPIEDCLSELTDAFCALLSADKTLGATCFSAYISKTQTVETLDDAKKGRLTALFELTVTVYA